ncbi:MAG: type III-A CRISPR-associated RAMP protein Csm3 [Caldimicrobium sp.]|nr:type III-A CRISPR-associated RAMP protein Csm3 [Caldimicrobium sp.]
MKGINSINSMKLQEIKVITGTIVLKTGLHIGSGNTEMQIGGVDNLVIKHPHTQEPYIPGSSLKGKIRALLEYYYGIPPHSYKINKKQGGLAHHELLTKSSQDISIPREIVENTRKILKIFGLSGSAGEVILEEIGPTRVAFADCFFTEDYRKELEKNNHPYTEIKAENRINRITGTAEHPRHTERVPAGAKFSFEITFKIFYEEDRELFKELLKGMKLLELDYLGGSGSRGYGRIKFEIDSEDQRKEFEDLNLFNGSPSKGS